MAGTGTPTALELTHRAQSLLYNEDVPNDTRFNGTSGQERLEMCFQMYEKVWQEALHTLQLAADLTAIPWYHPVDGRRLIVRHPLNQRQNHSHEQTLVKSVRSQSVCYGLRGECWIQISHDCMLLWSLAWGTLIDAIYIAMERYPHEETIIKLKGEGLRKCRVFDNKMPNSVSLWMKAFHNELGGQSHQVSALDWLDEWPSLMRQFGLKCKRESWNSRMEGYQQKMLESYRVNASSLLSKSIGGWSHVNEINSIVNFSKSYNGSHELLRGFYKDRVVIAQEVMVVNTDVLKVMYNVKGIVERCVKDQALRGLFWVAFSALAFPTDIDLKLTDKEACAMEGISRNDSTWVLRKATAENMKIVADLLEYKMTGSKAVKVMSDLDGDEDPRTPAPINSQEDDDDEPDAQHPKRRRGAEPVKPKRIAKAAAKSSRKQKDEAKQAASMRKLISSLEIPLVDLTWSDDVSALVRVCCNSAGFSSIEELAAQQVGFPIALESVKFAMVGKLERQSAKSTITKWSDFRRHILDQMKGIDVPTDADEIASMLLKSYSRDDDLHEEFAAATSLLAFLKSTDVRIPVRLQHAAMRTMQRVHVDDDFICELKSTVNDGAAGDCLKLIIGAVDNALKPEWFPLCMRLALTLINDSSDKALENQDVQDLLSKCGEDTQAKLTTLELVGKMRAHYTIMMLSEAARAIPDIAAMMPGVEPLCQLFGNPADINTLLQLDAAAVDRRELWKRLVSAKSEADITMAIVEFNQA